MSDAIKQGDEVRLVDSGVSGVEVGDRLSVTSVSVKGYTVKSAGGSTHDVKKGQVVSAYAPFKLDTSSSASYLGADAHKLAVGNALIVLMVFGGFLVTYIVTVGLAFGDSGLAANISCDPVSSVSGDAGAALTLVLCTVYNRLPSVLMKIAVMFGVSLFAFITMAISPLTSVMWFLLGVIASGVGMVLCFLCKDYTTPVWGIFLNGTGVSLSNNYSTAFGLLFGSFFAVLLSLILVCVVFALIFGGAIAPTLITKAIRRSFLRSIGFLILACVVFALIFGGAIAPTLITKAIRRSFLRSIGLAVSVFGLYFGYIALSALVFWRVNYPLRTGSGSDTLSPAGSGFLMYACFFFTGHLLGVLRGVVMLPVCRPMAEGFGVTKSKNSLFWWRNISLGDIAAAIMGNSVGATLDLILLPLAVISAVLRQVLGRAGRIFDLFLVARAPGAQWFSMTVKEGFKEPFWFPTIFETGLNRFLKLKNGVSALSAALNISIVAVGALAALTLQIILGGSNTPDVELGVSIATGVVCSLFVLDQIQLAPLIGIEVYAQVYTSASKSGILLVPSRIARVMKKMESK
eukprot:CAMPEP_0113900828 /NCGR_PEP_ID=MMETSP0780_2-20120614/20902_1 /TAXON_ID=652834 /ORGANISM="Palpitomonas bilix" /LENGTH=573 /DNA_ID=CAMNT_0000893347 /DNA_START=270 /DNA_END=1991 /DNA_ORIENTATION=+ /assembly_acc=CAM_ASM_000599